MTDTRFPFYINFVKLEWVKNCRKKLELHQKLEDFSSLLFVATVKIWNEDSSYEHMKYYWKTLKRKHCIVERYQDVLIGDS